MFQAVYYFVEKIQYLIFIKKNVIRKGNTEAKITNKNSQTEETNDDDSSYALFSSFFKNLIARQYYRLLTQFCTIKKYRFLAFPKSHILFGNLKGRSCFGMYKRRK